MRATLSVAALLAPSAAAQAQEAVDRETERPAGIIIDYAEIRLADEDTSLFFDATGELRDGGTAFVAKVSMAHALDGVGPAGEGQLRIAHALGPSVNSILGVRYDFGPGGDIAWLAGGGSADLTPWLATEALLFVSQDGDLAARTELVADLDLSSSFRLQPKAEVNWGGPDAAFRPQAYELAIRVGYTGLQRLYAYAGVIVADELEEMDDGAGPSAQVVIGLSTSF